MNVFLLTFLLILFSAAYSNSYALNVSLTPKSVNPGDLFEIKITGIGKSDAPSASIGDDSIDLESCGESCVFGIAAVDINSKPGARRVYVSTAKKKVKAVLTVNKPNFPAIKLTLPESKVTLSPEDSARAEEEAALLKSLWKNRTERMWNGDFIYPSPNEHSTLYGTKRIINKIKTSVHMGMDIRGKEGEPLKAANRGRVILAKELFFGGNTVVIDHGSGIFTVCMHLSGFSVKEGDTVQKGDIVGFIGATGRASGPHLHFGVKFHELSVNPESLMRLRL